VTSPPDSTSSAPPAPLRFVADEAGPRLDRWLAQRLPDRSRNQIQQDLAAGRVHVNGAAAVARQSVAPGDVILYALPPPSDPRPAAEPIPLTILYEDPHLAVVDKPAGLVVHPAPGHPGGTLVNALLARYGPPLQAVGGDARWGIVHRLDKDTSGLLLVARTAPAWAALTAAIAQRRVRREYLALVLGRLRDPAGVIDRPLARRERDRKKIGVVPDGRPARTDWRVLIQGDGLALLALRLHTGRTHQIRVHLQSIGRPVLGDPVYGHTRRRTLMDLPPPLKPVVARLWPDRQLLHAARLVFEHPFLADCRLSITSPPPPDMRRLIAAALPEAEAAIQAWLTTEPPPDAV